MTKKSDLLKQIEDLKFEIEVKVVESKYQTEAYEKLEYQKAWVIQNLKAEYEKKIAAYEQKIRDMVADFELIIRTEIN